VQLHILVNKREYLRQLLVDGLTSHEIGDVDCIAPFLGILVCEESAIWEFPAKDVGDEYDYAFPGCPFWSSHIGWETLIGNFRPSWLAGMNRPTYTVATLNCIHDDRVSRRLLSSMSKEKTSSFGRVNGIPQMTCDLVLYHTRLCSQWCRSIKVTQ
jgi:hypothetical protein